MRVLVANIAAARKADRDGAFVREVLGPLTRRNLALGAPAGTQFTLRWSEEGEVHPAFATCANLRRLADQSILPALAGAEQEGFDGAIVGCFGDPHLAECTQSTGIPIVGFGKAGMLAATAIGRRVGIVTPAAMLVDLTHAQAQAYGLAGALAGVVASTDTAAEQEAALTDSRQAIASFHQSARALIAMGADVLVPGCGLLSPVLRFAPGAEAQYPRGVTEVDGVPVIDVLAAASAMLTASVTLRAAGSAWRGVRGAGDRSGHPASINTFWDS